MTCLGSSGTGMPHEKVERLIERSRRPERTNEITSLRRVSGRMKSGIRVEFQQLVSKRRELEEVILFVNGFRDASASRAGITRLRAIDVEFVGDAILAGVSAFVDIAVVAQLAEQRLHALLVPIFGSADEVIVRNPHPLPQVPELGGDFIRVLLRSLAGSLRCALDFLTVLVGAGEEESFRAQHALPTSDRVAGDCCVGVADVRPRVDVVNRGRDVKLIRHFSMCSDCR